MVWVRRRVLRSATPLASHDGVQHRLLVPVPAGWRAARPAALGELLLAGARRMADGYGGRPCEVLLLDPHARRLWRLPELSEAHLHDAPAAQAQVFFNLAFLLLDPPPFLELHAHLGEQGLVLCGSEPSRELMAAALRRESVSDDALWELLGLLVAESGPTQGPDWPGLRARTIAPGPARTENSPTLQDVAGRRAGRLPESPGYLNTALAELLSGDSGSAPACAAPESVADALCQARERSRVPWIFNTWLNDVELRLGTLEPRSVPPELHLSVTGACNLECTFCGYTRKDARFDRVSADELERFSDLGRARVLRLNCGIGEPTLNRQLGDMLERVSARFAHLGINFFTNGLTLERHGLLPRLLGRVRWVNASLNAATRETWREQCGLDLFDQMRAQLERLRDAKREAGQVWPLVFGSTVLNRGNLRDLPLLPGLCRELGIDRLSAFPYFALVAQGAGKLGPETTLAACREEYDALYDETVRAAERAQVSLEIPPPKGRTRTSFGLEVRPLFDFARIECNEWSLGRFLCTLEFRQPEDAHCPFLWRQSSIGSTTRASRAPAETHFLYPCLGPLGAVDFSRVAAFRPPQAERFMEVWRGPVFRLLREGQHARGVSPVCDACRSTDTRDPQHFERLQRLTREFTERHC